MRAGETSRLFTLAVVMVALVLGSHAAFADDAARSVPPKRPIDHPGPLDLVKTSVSRALAIVQSQPESAQRRADIRQVGKTLFDFNEIARRTLGQHWADRSPQEQEEFVRVFRGFLERSYLTTIGSFRLTKATYQGESIEGSSAQVRSRLVTDSGAEIPVEYRLRESAGRWGVYDIVVEGVSLVGSYRTQFNTVIRSSSFPLLLESIEGARSAPEAKSESGTFATMTQRAMAVLTLAFAMMLRRGPSGP